MDPAGTKPSLPKVGSQDVPHTIGDRAHIFIDETGIHGKGRYICARLPDNINKLDLVAWWMRTAYDDVEQQMPKMIEYGGRGSGSSDLQVMGDAQAELLDMHDEPPAFKQELSIWFYILGKVSRLISNYKQRQVGKSDTWHDITVYSMMARRIQEVGRWP